MKTSHTVSTLLFIFCPVSSVSRLMRELQLETLQERHRIQRLTFMYMILNGQVAVPAELIDLELSVRTSRGDYNQQKLYKPRTHTTEYQKSFIHRTIPEWNSLPSSVAQSNTVSTFKCRLSALRRAQPLIAVLASGSWRLLSRSSAGNRHPISIVSSRDVHETFLAEAEAEAF